MKFTPKTEKEIKEANLWPVGEYGFEILPCASFGQKVFETCDTKSKGGNDMIQLVVKIYNDKGQFRTILDFLLEEIEYKLRHAAVACGLIDKYDSGELTANDFIGKTGFVKVGVQTDKKGVHPDSNAIKDYIVPKEGQELKNPPTQSASNFEADDIPWGP